MIHPVRYADLGQADFGWLQARYHFSFGDYINPARMGLGALRVINDDVVAAGHGFDPHPHRDMEIITYVRQGAISHRDNLGNEGRTAAGDVQVMSAGTGVVHAEYNLESHATRLYQIWITPHKKGVAPRWAQRTFPQQPCTQSLPVLVSGRAEHEHKGALFIHQEAAIYGGRVNAGTTLSQPLCASGYLLVSSGGVRVGAHELREGDVAEVVGEKSLTLTAITDAEVLLIDAPR